jgi:hypothetical protein
VERFAVGGTIEPLPRNAQQEGVAGVLVCPRHKSGDPHRTRVSAAVLEAAKRLLSYGSFATGHKGRGGTAYNRAIRAACAAVKRPDGGVGIPPFTVGMIRHSVATHAVNACGSVQAVAEFLGARGEDLAFVDNATAGANAVFASQDFRAGDEIVVTDLGYGGVTLAAHHWGGRAGATVSIELIPVTTPIQRLQVLDA